MGDKNFDGTTTMGVTWRLHIVLMYDKSVLKLNLLVPELIQKKGPLYCNSSKEIATFGKKVLSVYETQWESFYMSPQVYWTNFWCDC